MRNLLSLLFISMVSCLHVQAADSGWYLYIWSDTNNSGGDVGQFQTTGIEGVYVLEGVTTTESGLKYCIHNSGWGTTYGWSDGSEGSVSYTGMEVVLGTTSGATGWLGLAAGTYDVTFKLNTPSVQFDTPVPAVGNGSKKVSILGDSYSTYYGYLWLHTNASWYSIYTTQYYSDNDVTTVDQTWWYKFITGGDYVLERNNSYSGATMVNGCLSDMPVSSSFISRALDLGNPDIIFIFGGTNDWWNNYSFSLGEYKYSDWNDGEKAQFRPGFAYLLNLVKTTYAGKQIYFILNDLISDSAGGSSSTSNVRKSIQTICEHYEIPIIELEDIAKGSYHPTEAGMSSIAMQVQDYLDDEGGATEGNDWYISGDFNSWQLNTKFSRSSVNEFTIDNFIITSDQFDAYGGINFTIATTGWSQNYVCNSNISTLDTEYDFVLSTSEDAWASAYCTAMDTGKSYKLTWNKNTHRLTISQNSSAISYTTYADGHAVATVDGDYLRGGDISRLKYVEDLGAKFYDTNGTEKDALDIMQENGVNFVRLRLYNNPGETVTYGGTTYKMPDGYLGEDDVLALAKRAKAHNMKIQLTFHYSDFWTNGMCQFKPSGWEGYTFEQLKTAVYDYTKQFLEKMVAQGTTPEYVSLGNEIQNGMLFGYNTNSTRDAVSGYSHDDLAALMNEGSRAVREVCPDSKIIIHLTMNSNWNTARFVSFFNDMTSNSLDYDIIGASYYPYYTESKPSVLDNMATTLYKNFGKDLMIMEVGYSWTQYKPSERNGGNYEGQLHMNGDVYNEASEAGQKSFMQEVNDVVKGNDHILGYLYWDPIMVDQKVNSSWIDTYDQLHQYNATWYGDYNTVSNTTWFDYEGKALPVFEAIAEDAVNVPDNVTISGTSYIVEEEEPYTLTIGDTGYATFYDVQAREIPDGLTVYTVQSYTGNQLNLTEYEGANIPTATGVLLKGDEGTYYLWPRYDGNSSISGNMLYGTASEQTITTPTGSYYYYKLAKDKTNGLGWYWGANDGGVFTNGGHKAYLAVPQSQSGARSFISLFDEETTGISSMHNSQCIMYNECFDLQGRRVVNPTKGLYIVGGKKVIVK